MTKIQSFRVGKKTGSKKYKIGWDGKG